MPDYSKMYYRLFHSQTDAIAILQQAQRDAEELYVSSPDPELRVLEPKHPDNASDPEEK